MLIVIPSLNYSDYLRYTLPRWQAAFPDSEFRVVTSKEDVETQAVAGSAAFITDAFAKDEALFNKAAAMDEALSDRQRGDVILKIDCDVIPRGKLPEIIEPDTIYGCARYDEAGRLIRKRSRKNGLIILHTPEQNARRCLGFFQMFRYDPKRKFGSYPTGGQYDIDFRNKFHHRIGLTNFYVTHVGPMSKENWKGRVHPPLVR